MSSLYTPGLRPAASPVLPSVGQVGGKAYGTQIAPASGKVAARLPVVDPTSFQDDNVSLSSAALQRTGALATDTLDAAQKLIDTFVGKLFGDQARGASVEFDSVSLEAQASFSASASLVSNAEGTTRSAEFALNESASFIGKGQLVTADGQSFDFEIEIQYEASVEASATQSTSAGAAETESAPKRQRLQLPDEVVLTGKPLPAIKYPGSLDDLFKLLGKELSGSVNGRSDEAQGGNMTLRLLRLVDRAALLAPRLPDDPAAPQPSAAERSKAAASSYAAQAADGAAT